MQKAREDILTLWILFCLMTEKWDTSSLQATYTRQELPVSEYGRSVISFTRLSLLFLSRAYQ
jgi:hypothetical protein